VGTAILAKNGEHENSVPMSNRDPMTERLGYEPIAVLNAGKDPTINPAAPVSNTGVNGITQIRTWNRR
jgi:hypothetical protein